QSDGQRHNDVAQAHNGWNDIRQEQEGLAGLVTGQTQVISCQLDAVGQVEEEAQHCQYVENGYWPAAKGCHHVGLNSASYECIRRCRCNTHGEIQDVENNEEQEHDAGDQHGAGRKGAHAAHQVGATELAARLTCTAVRYDCAINVSKDCYQQNNANNPQQCTVRQERLTDATQEFTVDIESFLENVSRSVELQVDGHVTDNKQSENQARYSHGQLQRPRRSRRLRAQLLISNVTVIYGFTVRIFNSHDTSIVANTLRRKNRRLPLDM